MQKFFALIFTFTYLIQLMSPVIIWAQTEDPLSNTEVVEIQADSEIDTNSNEESSDENSEENIDESSDQSTDGNESDSTDNTTTSDSSINSDNTDTSDNTSASSDQTQTSDSNTVSNSDSKDINFSPSPASFPTPLPSPTPTVEPSIEPSQITSLDNLSATTSAVQTASTSNDLNNTTTSTTANNSDDDGAVSSSNDDAGSSNSDESNHEQGSSGEESNSVDQGTNDDLTPLPDETEMQTGDSAAVADSTTLINSQLQNSCLLIDTYNLTGEEDADFSDLYCSELSEDSTQTSLPGDQASSSAQLVDETENQSSISASQTPTSNTNFITPTTTELENSAEVDQEVEVSASTGENESSAEDLAAIFTGDAVALALIQQIVNTTLIDSQLIYQIFNIWPSFFGDLILPRQDQVLAGTSTDSDICTNCGGAISLLNNNAQIDQTVDVSANTGGNSATGEENWLETGDAYAAANVINLANSQLSDLGWYLLLFNVAGEWQGQLFNWNDEYSVIGMPIGQFALTDGQLASLNGTQQSEDSILSNPNESNNLNSGSADSYSNLGNQSLVNIDNQTTLTQNVQVSANTGGNTASADTTIISTGNAISIANLFNLINSTIVNSSLYIGIINILGDWTGNVRLAYPELAINIAGDQESVQLGETVTYQINYLNKGYDDADDAVVSLNIPAGMEVISYSQSELGQQSLNSISWNLGEVPENQGGSLSVTLSAVDWDHLSSADTQSKSWLSSLIPSVQAVDDESSKRNERDERQVTVSTQISSSEPQASTKANQAQVTTVIYQIIDDDGNDDGDESELPIGGMDQADNQSDSDSESDPNDWPMSLDVHHNVVGFVYPLDTVTFNVEVENQADAPVEDLVVIHEIVQQGEVLVQIGFPLGKLPAHKKGQLEFGLEIPDLALQEYQVFETRTWVEARTNTGGSFATPVRTTNFGVQPRWFGWSFESVPTVSAFDDELTDSAQAQPEVLGDQIVQSATQDNDQRRWWVLSGLLIFFLIIRIIRSRQEDEENVIIHNQLD